MAECKVCREESLLISEYLGVCVDCIRNNFPKAEPFVYEAYKKTREDFNLVISLPKNIEGISCKLCVNECKIGKGEREFCGLREDKKGKIVGANPSQGNLTFYFDHLPTNCLADFVCLGGTDCRYSKFSHQKGPEYGYKNLTVFYHGCSFNCLFC